MLLNAALSNQYLMCEALSMSALHISRIRSEGVEMYRQEAVSLQAQALSLFNANMPGVTPEDSSAVVIFATLLGLVSLADTCSAHEANADGFS